MATATRSMSTHKLIDTIQEETGIQRMLVAGAVYQISEIARVELETVG